MTAALWITRTSCRSSGACAAGTELPQLPRLCRRYRAAAAPVPPRRYRAAAAAARAGRRAAAARRNKEAPGEGPLPPPLPVSGRCFAGTTFLPRPLTVRPAKVRGGCRHPALGPPPNKRDLRNWTRPCIVTITLEGTTGWGLSRSPSSRRARPPCGASYVLNCPLCKARRPPSPPGRNEVRLLHRGPPAIGICGHYSSAHTGPNLPPQTGSLLCVAWSMGSEFSEQESGSPRPLTSALPN